MIAQAAPAPGIVPMKVLSSCSLSGGAMSKFPSTAFSQNP